MFNYQPRGTGGMGRSKEKEKQKFKKNGIEEEFCLFHAVKITTMTDGLPVTGIRCS